MHYSRPTIVCLCGSTRFSEAFQKANLDETLAGNIVLTIGCDLRSDAEVFAGKTEDDLKRTKLRLDALHLRKIDLADEVLILNVDGYVGESTRRELEYAVRYEKAVRWLEPDKAIAVGVEPQPRDPMKAIAIRMPEGGTCVVDEWREVAATIAETWYADDWLELAEVGWDRTQDYVEGDDDDSEWDYDANPFPWD